MGLSQKILKSQIWKKCLLKSDCVPALTLLKCTFCKRRDWAGEQMSLEPPTESDIGQEGIKADLSAEGMIESRTGPEEPSDTRPNAVRLLVPRTRDPTLTRAEPVKYRVKHACCTTGLLSSRDG